MEFVCRQSSRMRGALFKGHGKFMKSMEMERWWTNIYDILMRFEGLFWYKLKLRKALRSRKWWKGIEVVEVLEGKIVFSRQDLRGAFFQTSTSLLNSAIEVDILQIPEFWLFNQYCQKTNYTTGYGNFENGRYSHKLSTVIFF